MKMITKFTVVENKKLHHSLFETSLNFFFYNIYFKIT